SPGRCRMTAAQELLVDGFVTGAAICRAYLGVDDKSVVIGAGLARRHLMAIEAGDTLFGMFTQLVLVNDGILKIAMAFGALAARAHQRRIWLFDLHPGPARIH